jgi:hypothetical protein
VGIAYKSKIMPIKAGGSQVWITTMKTFRTIYGLTAQR